MRAAFIIAAKDLSLQLREGTTLIFGLVLPLGLAFLFSSIIGDPEEGFQASYVVADEDRGAAATAFSDELLPSVAEGTSFEVEPVGSADEAARLVEDGEADAAFVVPAGFSADVESGRTATLQVVGNADAGIASYVAREIARSYATEVGRVQLAVAVGLAGGEPGGDPAELAERARAVPPAMVLGPDSGLADRELDPRTYYTAGMAVFFLFFVAMLSVSGILEERSNQTMARLLAAPVSRPAILVGKLLGGVGVGVAAMAVLVVSSSLLIGASWGTPLGVAALVVAAVLAATGIMALIATLARTTEQATNWMSVLSVLFGLFGGSFVPLAQLGGLAQVSYATPHRWFLQGLSDLAGGDLAAVAAPVAVLLAFAVGSFALTLLRIGKVIAP